MTENQLLGLIRQYGSKDGGAEKYARHRLAAER